MNLLVSDYAIHLEILIGIALILAQGLNVVFGYGGLLNLAHIAVYALGGYTTALLATELGKPAWFCLLASMAVGAFCALPIGAIALRLRGDYFAIGSLAFSAMVTAVLVNWKDVTHGVLGIPGIPRPEIFGISLKEGYQFRNFILVINMLVAAALYGFARSPIARLLRAQREHLEAAQAIGIEPRAIRQDAFLIASALAGLAGSLYTYHINYIDPSSFSFSEMVFVLSIVVIGRPGSYWGIIGATALLVLLPEPLRQLPLPSSVLGPMRQLIHALLLYSALWLRRRSLFPNERLV